MLRTSIRLPYYQVKNVHCPISQAIAYLSLRLNCDFVPSTWFLTAYAVD